ncbi:LemA family protein [Solitalea koreensis]|uniref:LemA protein n=1 Tax=Solitalea koreensis TaxID=543615 RepID=A0A521CSH1_9SPHI|nr:LemA family protein [Solitalea koreensis]SMO62403.1 LemA protein [Solitalea koreensis]
MKKISLGIIAFLALFLLVGGCNGYNNMVTLDQNVKKQWGQVQTSYQRRADLIPNLVNTVKGYANFEKETLTQVIEARAKATAVNIDANNLNPENFQKFQEAQQGVSSALSRLLVTVEKYPELKANQNFLELQAQLEGTENRISVERNKFNEVTGDYNTTVKRFPNNLYAGMFGFAEKPYFQAAAGSEKAPTVQF